MGRDVSASAGGDGDEDLACGKAFGWAMGHARVRGFWLDVHVKPVGLLPARGCHVEGLAGHAHADDGVDSSHGPALGRPDAGGVAAPSALSDAAKYAAQRGPGGTSPARPRQVRPSDGEGPLGRWQMLARATPTGVAERRPGRATRRPLSPATAGPARHGGHLEEARCTTRSLGPVTIPAQALRAPGAGHGEP